MDLARHLDPELRAALPSLPAIVDPTEDLQAARRQLVEKLAAGRVEQRPGVRRTDLVVPGPADNPDGVPVRLYEPCVRVDDLPGLLWIHGGGFVLRTLEQNDQLCDWIVDEIGAVVVSVDYRLAPEHPFPAGPEDCYAALRWFLENAVDLAVDRSRIGVAGISGGGGLAAAVALMARDRGELRLAFQMPLCASLDDRHITRSSRQITEPRVWNHAISRSAWRAYLGDAAGGAPSAYAAPARASDLTGLPPAYLAVGQLDVFCDENVEYGRRLLDAGVPTELHVYPSAFHGFEVLVPTAQISKDALADRERALRRALHPPSREHLLLRGVESKRV